MNQINSCSRYIPVSNSNSICSNGSVFDPAYYIQNFKVIQDPTASLMTLIPFTVNRPTCVNSNSGISLCCVLSNGTLTDCTTSGASTDFTSFSTDYTAISLPKPFVLSGNCNQAVIAVS